MAKRRRKGRWRRRLPWLLAAPFLLYLAAALGGALIPLNRDWAEAEAGTTIYLRSNGVHVDLLLPAKAQGLDWRPLLPERDFRDPPPDPGWFAFGAGERRVYLETPAWGDLTPRTLWAALAGGERVMHVELVAALGPEMRAIRLRPEEYRRLWSSIRAEFALDDRGRPRRVDHPGYWTNDAFYEGRGRASAINTCNQWATDRLRLAGIETGVWTPFAQSLLWRYRRADQST